MTITEIRNILESPYDRKVWSNFIQTQFTNNKMYGSEQKLSLSDNTISKHCLSLGNYEINEYTKIGIFEVELNEKVNITRNRVALRNLTKDITKQVAGAMVVFVQGDKWRFSYISKRKVKNKDTNEIEDKETAPKRYTYLFGKNEKALTAAIRFDKLIQKQKENIFQFLNLDDFEEAFSVEKLGKEFFKNYKDSYEDFVQFLTGKRYAKKGNKYTEQVIHEPDWQLTALFGKDEKQARDFCKRMMGRIVFLYFIQKKGWLSVTQDKKWGEGNPDYLFDLFKRSKAKDDFYASELVPLFFNRLNNEDSENEARAERFPYLNGGLFDDSHDRNFHKLHLPEEVFENLFETFNNFNFTVYEDAPDEHTVAVDPEMLGHIFENLLEDNQDKGAFYTPKEIVHYMSKESLKAYLIAHDEQLFAVDDLGNSTLDKIIHQLELTSTEKQFAEKHAYKIIDALDQVKICDPAIGSGAFPMGLLQEIFNAQIFLQELKGFKKGVSDADIKKHIIEESIYGVDIDAGAVDIARLRFWLSLVVDEPEPQPLPNLDFKIICANTLIPLGELSGFDMEAKASLAVKELEKLRHDFFKVSSDNKLKLERQFKKIQNDLLNLRELTTKENYEIYTKLYGFNPFDFEAAPCSWFDSWWMFGVKDGFDIVIGNPPYRQLQKDGGKLAKLYQPHNYDTFERTGDIYSIFYERGVELLKEKGVLCYITSNKWMRANYGTSTRQFFAEKTHPLLVIDFGNVQVFDTATVDTNILILQNKPKAWRHEIKATYAVRITNDFNIDEQSLQEYVHDNGYDLTSLSHNAWVIGERDIYNIKEVVEQQGEPLGNWNIVINYGLKTGLNEAFIITDDTRELLIEKDRNSAEIIMPLLRGKDLTAWYPDYKNLWLINAHNGVKQKNINRLNIEIDYPAIYEWLSNFKSQLIKRRDKGDHWTNLRNCAYLEDFDKPKILYPEITKYIPFIYDEEDHFYANNKNFILSGERLKYLTCFLNSKIFKYCFLDNFPELQGGSRELRKVFIEKIPVKRITDKEEIPFTKIVDYLVALKKEKSTEPNDQLMYVYFEQIANALVFELYFQEEFLSKELVIAKHVSELPDLDKNEKALPQLRKIYVGINQQHHPLKQGTFSMLAIPQIELIMNSDLP
ncbi:MAG: Eco57I restriction-modification methylase domain-containing protein [Reichenbachiella sp.]|uniref:Eco57I restriction-modification methylase domain-containing protein n=1 Tax=Reichenbachiella sp. TaxID=2184521 RepID=UPI0032983267